MTKCKNCYGKGYATVMESLVGFDDFVYGEGLKASVPPTVYVKFCTCRKGKTMETKAKKKGARLAFVNLYKI